MADPEDALPAAEEALVNYILDRALEAEPRGVAATECDAVVRSDAARLLHTLVFKRNLLASDARLYYPHLSAMRRRALAFAESIAPLQGVLDYGHQVLDDRSRRDKVANVDDVALSLVERFPSLSATPVRVRFNWALFGLQPFVDVQGWSSEAREPRILQFTANLYRVSTLDEVFREQQIANDELGILEQFREAYRQSRRRKGLAMVLGENQRMDRALRSLIDKGEAEKLDIARVVVTEQGLESDVLAENMLLNDSAWPSSTQNPEKAPEQPNPLAQLLGRLAKEGALTPAFASLLERDAQEVNVCLRGGAHKAALILCGSILEGVLVAVLARNQGRADAEFKLLKGKQRKSFPDEASLPDLVALARKPGLREGLGPLLTEFHGDLARLVTGHRDLVHPHAEVREEKLPINEHTAMAVQANLCVLRDGLARQIETGWLDQYRDH
jgi:hypothetical protein